MNGQKVFGTWIIGQQLGKGGFGEVWEIHKEVLGRTQQAALKRIPVTDEKQRTRIIAEMEAMQKLRGHPHIVEIQDVEEARGSGGGLDVLIRMELLTGLGQRIAAAPLPPGEVAKLGIHICRALEAAAKHQILHRDIKPANILFSSDGIYKLGDFGIARAFEADKSMSLGIGTEGFIAPEAMFSKSYDGRADLYSLGITLYYLLNKNRFPFHGDDESMQRRYLNREALPAIPGVAAGLMSVVLKACQHSAAQRFANAAEMLRALEGLLQAAPAAPAAPRPAPQPANQGPTVQASQGPTVQANQEESRESIKGNTAGNIVNGGHVAGYEGCVYFSFSLGDFPGIYKITKEDKIIKLSDDHAYSINIVDGWVYYSNWSDSSRLYQMRTDGSGRTRFNDEHAYDINVTDEWIYYMNGSIGNSLYKIKPDGSDRRQIAEGNCLSINVVGGWVYYRNSYIDRKGIYKVRTDGREKTILSEYGEIIVEGGWCYIKLVDGPLYKMRTEGGGLVQLTDASCGAFNVAGGWIYYQSVSNGYALFKMRTDGTEKTKLCDDQCFNGIHIVDQWLFYQSDGLKAYRINVNGGKRQALLDIGKAEPKGGFFRGWRKG
jgi:serine/threonine protein kinase